MPTYEYLCNKCEYAFEVVQSFSDTALEDCPKCDGQIRKVYNNVGIVFKGSGFYKTDSRTSSATKPDTKSDSKSDTKSDSKSESKSEVKKEVKSESKAQDKK
jgi:putative FmdB family regulatory protein